MDSKRINNAINDISSTDVEAIKEGVLQKQLEDDKGERILTDKQLIELHDDIKSGVSMIVSVKHHKEFHTAVINLINMMEPQLNTVECNCSPQIVNKVKRLLGPEPKDPPRTEHDNTLFVKNCWMCPLFQQDSEKCGVGLIGEGWDKKYKETDIPMACPLIKKSITIALKES